MRSGRVPGTHASVPVALGCATPPPGTRTCPPTQRPSAPHTAGIFKDASSSRRDQSLTPRLAPLPRLENRAWDGKFQASDQGLGFLGRAAPMGGGTKSHVIKSKVLLSPRRFQGAEELCVRPGAQDQALGRKMLLVLSSLRK